ncbi:MAG: SUMF1/EgtB/PvdO family nonheme iron enzyme [Planctomycetia bacterium]|nr:SUMF1/EgtB/PvdO family nonheme iron enzyme [Planctomycetia bacterium]
MSKKATKPPAAEPSPVGKWLAELEAVRHVENDRERSDRAWRVVLAAADHDDSAVLLDYALEHGLVLPGDAGSKSWNNPIDGSEMIWIPPGPFVVGEENEPATCAGFSLARHPVTNAQFKRFLDETNYQPDATLHPEIEHFLSYWVNGKPPKHLERHPVVWVSLLDADAYCHWAGMQLPTEWLWEKAARGPEGRQYPWGSQTPLGKSLAQVGAGSTCPVGSFPRTRTPYGCEDLIGNVSEWCEPTPEGEYGQLPRRQFGESGHVFNLRTRKWLEPFGQVRGSCYLRSNSQRMSAWHRRRLSLTRRNQWVGFRPACYLPCRPAV